MDGRLGLNIHRDHWPTAPALKAHEAAGFTWVQVHTPPRAMLADRERCRRHARAFDGLLDYAQETRAELIAYHGLNFLDADGPAGERIRQRAVAEERSLT